jgi:hypothetical protein
MMLLVAWCLQARCCLEVQDQAIHQLITDYTVQLLANNLADTLAASITVRIKAHLHSRVDD